MTRPPRSCTCAGIVPGYPQHERDCDTVQRESQAAVEARRDASAASYSDWFDDYGRARMATWCLVAFVTAVLAAGISAVSIAWGFVG